MPKNELSPVAMWVKVNRSCTKTDADAEVFHDIAVKYNARPMATVEEVTRLAEKIKDNRTLCKLFDGKPRASEAEYMVAQTIHAAKINATTHGQPFFFKGDNCESCSGGGLADNATAYGWLVKEEFSSNKNGVVELSFFLHKN